MKIFLFRLRYSQKRKMNRLKQTFSNRFQFDLLRFLALDRLLPKNPRLTRTGLLLLFRVEALRVVTLPVHPVHLVLPAHLAHLVIRQPDLLDLPVPGLRVQALLVLRDRPVVVIQATLGRLS